MSTYIKKFIQYTLYGSGAAIVDITILWTSVEIFGTHYLFATIVAFIAATLLNYAVFRKFLFGKTEKSFQTGYVYFVSFASIGLILTAASMVFFIEVIDMNVLVARVVTAIIVGVWNFTMNYFLTFRAKERKNFDF